MNWTRISSRSRQLVHQMWGSQPPRALQAFWRLSSLCSLAFSKQDCLYLCSLLSSVSSGAHCTRWLQLPSRHLTVFVFGCFSAVSWLSVNNPVLQIAWLRYVLPSSFETVIHSVHAQSLLSPQDWRACFKNKSQNRLSTRGFHTACSNGQI